MSIRPAISTPLPWLTMLAGRFFGKAHAKRRLKLYFFPRSLKFTKFGRNFVIALIILGTAAINTGNNLLYLVAAALMSLIIISGILSESTLRKLGASRTVPSRIYKNTPSVMALTVRNSKPLLPSYSFTIKELDEADTETKAAYVLKLDAEKETTVYAGCLFKRRGMFTLEGVEFKTGFPFGLFTKGRTVLTEERVLVYPEVHAIESKEHEPQASSGRTAAKKTSHGMELYGLRDYTALDDARHIHWKASARTMTLLTKEYHEEREKRALIAFDNYDDAPEAFERAVDEAASVAAHYFRSGYSIALKTLDRTTGYGTDTRHLDEIMTILSLVAPAKIKGKATVRIAG